MSHSITWEKRGPFVRYSGLVDFADFMGAITSVHNNPEYASIRYVIHDMSGPVEFDFSAVDMTTIASLELGARYTNPDVRAAVASRNESMGAFIAQFSAMTQIQIGFFPTVEEARAWADRSVR
jgi:hypothetical protein